MTADQQEFSPPAETLPVSGTAWLYRILRLMVHLKVLVRVQVCSEKREKNYQVGIRAEGKEAGVKALLNGFFLS